MFNKIFKPWDPRVRVSVAGVKYLDLFTWMMSFEILYIVHKQACFRREARGSHSGYFIIKVTLEEYL